MHNDSVGTKHIIVKSIYPTQRDRKKKEFISMTRRTASAMAAHSHSSPTSWWKNCIFLLSLSLLQHCAARSPFLSKHLQWWGRLRGGSSVSQDSTRRPVRYFPVDNDGDTTTNTTTSNKTVRYFPVDENTNTSSTATNQTSDIPLWKQNLPEPLCNKKARTFQRICIPYQNQVAEIYLLGTAHVSNDSSRDVNLLLESLALLSKQLVPCAE